MATLLHIDSSALPFGSTSRDVTQAFKENWLAQHPEGTVVYRDLGAQPVPHLDAAGISAGFSDPATHNDEQKAAMALRDELATELENADVILIGAPMYNLTIPSTLKAWLDQVVIMGRTAGENSTLAGKPAVVVASRGGAYGPGTPREGADFAATFLEKALTDFFQLEVHVIIPELTLAKVNPAMAELIPLSEASREQALAQAAGKAKELAARVAGA
ncbi:FMN-dependent NADH-azoreductase [Streptomyces viridiviolaceus]|uniref:FMN dependent NADH:quinone oxidoreductase n=1 Tax=Streptomyces viridiviolaceus TaxID=68282 RepID=A0ABW2DZI5_9ACTN|nr:NAD(P)H-dependent oxidoreductase [Streptomyces viridiviolaceus]GHB58102.1 FMN-dependent NADH-azoreductase [Streptomyces viridiviolaceus]